MHTVHMADNGPGIQAVRTARWSQTMAEQHHTLHTLFNSKHLNDAGTMTGHQHANLLLRRPTKIILYIIHNALTEAAALFTAVVKMQ